MANYAYDPRQVNHGSKYGFFSPLSQDPVTGQIDFGQIYEFTGLTGSSLAPKQSTDYYYSDDSSQVTLLGVPQVQGNITAYQFRPEFAPCIGKQVITATGAITDAPAPTNFLFGYWETIQTKAGATYNELHVWLNVQSGVPTGDAKSDADKPTPKELTFPVNANPNESVVDANGFSLTSISMLDKDGSLFTFFDSLFATAATKKVGDLVKVMLGTETIPTT